MAVRNAQDIGENLHKIVTRLLANDTLVKLMYYSDTTPLSHANLTDEEKTTKVFGKILTSLPYLGQTETDKTCITILVDRTVPVSKNGEFKDVSIKILSYHPYTTWFIANNQLRPFYIMGEIQNSLDGKTINGLGKMSGGDFQVIDSSHDVITYSQSFVITSYD